MRYVSNVFVSGNRPQRSARPMFKSGKKRLNPGENLLVGGEVWLFHSRASELTSNVITEISNESKTFRRQWWKLSHSILIKKSLHKMLTTFFLSIYNLFLNKPRHILMCAVLCSGLTTTKLCDL